MSSDDERDEKELGLTSPEVVTKYKSAAEIVNKALQVVLAECKPKTKIVDICEKGDAFIKEQTSSIYKKKKIERGVAFPTCISVNNTVGHFSPLASDETVLEGGDMVKIDMGCHIDGFIVLVGHTHVLQEGPVTGRKADVITAANTAAEVALRLVRPGNKNTQVTEAIQKVAAAYDCKIVEGVLSHQMKQFTIDGTKSILSVSSPETRVEDVEFEENEVYAIDIVASTGDGKPKLLDKKQTTIYKKVESVNYHSEIKENFSRMPFNERSLEENRARLGLVEYVNRGHLQPYPVLYENPGDIVAKIKFTVLLMPNGSDRITSHKLQELQPTKTMVDSEIKGWLALGIKKKKGGEKKKATKIMTLSSSSHQAIDDLVKLLVSSSLFSRESERKWAKGFNIVETKNMTEDEQTFKALEDSHFRLITYLGNKIFPTWNEEGNNIHNKIKENVNKQNVLDESLSTALLWVDRSHDTIDSTQVTYLELNDHVRTLFSGPYLDFDCVNKIDFKECKEIPVFVDFENCQIIPDDKGQNFYNVNDFVRNITATLKGSGFGGEDLNVSVTLVGKTRSFHRDETIATAITISLADQDVVYHHATNAITGVPDTADKKMIVSVMSFMHAYLSKYNEGCVVVLCTSDLDFLGTIRELKRHNFYVILVHNEHEANPKLTRAPDRRFLWHKFIGRAKG